MQRPLQLVEHISAKAGGEGLPVDDGVDESSLGLEDGVDEIVDRVLGDEVGDVDRPGLADSVRAVLGLPVVRRHPVEVVEHDLRGRGQVQPGAPRDDVRQEHTDVLLLLESIDEPLTLSTRGLSREHDRSWTEGIGKPLNRIAKHEKTITFSPLDRASHEVDRRRRLRERERLARFDEKREQLSRFRASSVAGTRSVLASCFPARSAKTF